MSLLGPGSYGQYLPIEFDVPPNMNFSQFMELFSKRHREIASLVNGRTDGHFDTVERQNNEQFFNNEATRVNFRTRYVFRKVLDIVALNAGNVGSGATVTVAHGISNIVTPTRIYGTATGLVGGITTTYFPLPFASATANRNIEIYLDNTNVTVINGAGQPALTQCYVIFEYTKN